MKGAGMLVIPLTCRGINFRFSVSLRVFWTKWQYFQPSGSHLGLYMKKYTNIKNFGIF